MNDRLKALITSRVAHNQLVLHIMVMLFLSFGWVSFASSSSLALMFSIAAPQYAVCVFDFP